MQNINHIYEIMYVDILRIRSNVVFMFIANVAFWDITYRYNIIQFKKAQNMYKKGILQI